jgi:hypothetical protein
MNLLSGIKLTTSTMVVVISIVALCIHFFLNFFVSNTVDQREQQLPTVPKATVSGVYDYQQLLEKINKLNATPALSAENAEVAPASALPERFDSWHTDDHSVGLMAIYQHHEMIALLSFKQKSQAKTELVRLKTGEQFAGITLAALTARTATLEINSQQRTLRLFTPGLESKQQPTPDIEN